MNDIKLARDIGVVHNMMRQSISGSGMMKNLREKINNSEGIVIDFINFNKDKAIYQKDIEKVLMVRRSTVTELLNKMERKDLIERKSVTLDKRLKQIVLTEKAIEFHSEIQEQLMQVEKSVRSGLSEHEIIILHGILNKLKETFKSKCNK